MAWVDGVDRATGYLVTSTNWNDYNGATGDLMTLKSHAHGGTTGEGSTSIGPLVLADLTDAAAPAAPGSGKTRLFATSSRPHYRAGAAGADFEILTEDMFDAKGDLMAASAADQWVRLAVGSDAQVLVADSTQASGLKWAASALTTASADLGSDQTISVANTYTDGATVSLAAGTWFVVAACTVNNISTGNVTARISDGSTHYASGQRRPPANDVVHFCMAAVITLGSTTTMKVQATIDAGTTSLIKAATTVNGSGNNATHIRGIKVA